MHTPASAPFMCRLDFASQWGGAVGLAAGDATIIRADTLAEVLPALAQLEVAWRGGQQAIGFLAYEAASAFDASLKTHPPLPGLPLLWFAVADQLTPIAPPLPVSLPANAFTPWVAALAEGEYSARVAALQRLIADGATYQVNFTFPLRAHSTVAPATLYAALANAQPAPGRAYLDLGDWRILSLSPELFFLRQGQTLLTRPMKGTRPRGLWPAADQALAAELAASPKERAENIMIVDLLRNDLGRVAQPGSVHAGPLRQLEAYPTVWQMVSEVRATPRPELGLRELLTALFPCGSVTGAPKVKTMEIIATQERGPRGVYCGAIGRLGPWPDCVFNVAIRTLLLRADGQARYDVGSGIVADSQAASEYAECRLKAQVLTRPAPAPFDLLETLRWEPAHGYLLLDRHLARLAASATYFAWPVASAAWRASLLSAAQAWTSPQRVRLLLSPTGGLTLTQTPLTDDWGTGLCRLRLARSPVNPETLWLYHKTTQRAIYDAAFAERGTADDVLLWNTRGELTESTRANFAVRLAGKWFTPPVSCGLLGGTLRAELLATGELREQVLPLTCLAEAEELAIFNSVRGRQRAEILT